MFLTPETACKAVSHLQSFSFVILFQREIKPVWFESSGFSISIFVKWICHQDLQCIYFVFSFEGFVIVI